MAVQSDKKKSSGILPIVAGCCLLAAVAGCVQKKVLPPAPVTRAVAPPAAPAEKTALPPADSCQGTEASAREVVMVRTVRLPDTGLVARRIAFYTEEEKKWRSDGADSGTEALVECSRLGRQALAGYRAMLRTGDGYVVEELLDVDPWQVTAADFAYLQKGCPDLGQPSPAMDQDLAAQQGMERDQALDRDQGAQPLEDRSAYRGAAAAMADATVAAFHDLGKWQDSITAYENLGAVFPDWQPSRQARLAHADSLVKLGRIRDGVAVLGRIAEQEQDLARRYDLLRRVADMQLAAGEKSGALDRYDQLAVELAPLARINDWVVAQRQFLQSAGEDDPVLSIYQNVLWEYFLFDGRHISDRMKTAMSQLRTFYAGSPVREHAEHLYAGITDRVNSLVEQQLAAIRQAIDDRDFSGAARLEAETAELELSPLQAERLQQLGRERRDEEQRFRRLRAQEEAERLAAAWRAAEDLFEHQDWDGAINAYTALLSSDYAEQATERIAEAADRAAVTLRRRAAFLFLQGKKAADPAEKRQLLEQSMQLLEQISVKYPQASILDKVAGNMAAIRRELARLQQPEQAVGVESGMEFPVVR